MSSPNAQMPAETFHSVRLGTYSTISCIVEGMKPGTMRPMPFSIQTPIKAMMHAVMTYLFWLDVLGEMKRNAAMKLQAMAVQIHGTSAVFPCKPKKRYCAAAVCAPPV